MLLIKDDHVVETLTSNGADHPFDKWILPRGARCGKDLLYPETVDASIEVRSVGLVSIPSCAALHSGPFATRPQGQQFLPVPISNPRSGMARTYQVEVLDNG